ncbi:MAG: hypothetical protein WA001_02735 [Patescibacteria group bacterium]
MTNQLTSYLFSILAVAGFAVIWRNWLEDHPKFRSAIKTRLPWPFPKALTCGSCFTYWLSLGFILAFDPLPTWQSSWVVTHIFLVWMAVAMGAVFIRFSYVLVQERVHDIVHARDRHEAHDDPKGESTP